MEHGCPYDANVLWVLAAREGHISLLEFLQHTGVPVTPLELILALLTAGLNSHLAAARWLRVHGAEWPATLSNPLINDGQQWEGAVLEWARAEGCTAPLAL
jgi:hypothetical protein